ncbi:unnamed protein product, partial [Meganyctiphanes norvegica]
MTQTKDLESDRLLRVRKQNSKGPGDRYHSGTDTSVLGTPQPGQQPTGADTIERLIERIQSSTLLEDRRDGCRALRAMSRKYRVLVGAHAMDSIMMVLETDRNDHETVNYALETLVNITSPDVYDEETEDDDGIPSSQAEVLGEQFTEILTKRAENISLLVGMLDEFDFKIRYPTIRLLTNLIKNRPKELQDVILVIPSGVSKLMDQLSDSREVIRNDTLLLLTQLVKGNTSLQKIVAFENAYDHLFEIIREEGYADGGVVVEDCLQFLINLLRNNPSNQTFFKEGSYIQKLTSFFTLPSDNEKEGWSAQKVANLHYMMKLVRSLVSPQNAAAMVSSCQASMHTSGLLQILCGLLMATGVPADILTDTLTTVSEIIRGHPQNQEFFANVMAPSHPPRPAIVVLLMSMVNEKQPFVLRCAVLYCFQCFLYHNQTGQAQIIQTLLPQTADGIEGAELFANQVTAGQLLCGGLFAPDPVSNWFSSVALSHALLDNVPQKRCGFKGQFFSAGVATIKVMEKKSHVLDVGFKVATRFGILMLLSSWLSNCPIAAQHFLSSPPTVPFLTTTISSHEHDELEVLCQGLCAFILGLCAQFNDGSVPSFSRDSLVQLVSNRIGSESFADKLGEVSRNEAYSKALKYPQLIAAVPSDLLFDHEFCKLFKNLEASVLRSVTPQLVNGNSSEVSPGEVIKYKDIIRDQDAEITNLRGMVEQLQKQMQEVTALREEENSKINFILDENTVFHIGDDVTQRVKETRNGEVSVAANGETLTGLGEQLQQTQQQLAEITYARDYYYYQATEKDSQIQALQLQNGVAQESGGKEELDSFSNAGMETLQKQLQDLQLVLHTKDAEIQQLQESVANVAATQPIDADTEEVEQVSHLEMEIETLRNKNTTLGEEKMKLECQLQESLLRQNQIEDEVTKAKLNQDNSTKTSSSISDGVRCKELENELEILKKEQEDLLVLLTDQDTKMAVYKGRLIDLGESVSDDEDTNDIDIDHLNDDDDDDDDLNNLQ